MDIFEYLIDVGFVIIAIIGTISALIYVLLHRKRSRQ
ncbi:EYxxD motif small membrane protein [Thalassobacillus sp. CUG 92003]